MAYPLIQTTLSKNICEEREIKGKQIKSQHLLALLIFTKTFKTKRGNTEHL
tara:strand:+ start:137 stop:289 length:153 start_codon:yes stop_codon:yes gene_type:complete